MMNLMSDIIDKIMEDSDTSELKNYPYGAELSMAFTANSNNDYDIAFAMSDSKGVNIDVCASGENFLEVVSALMDDIVEEYEEQTMDEEDLAEKEYKEMWGIIRSLETDNKLLEQRVAELMEQNQQLRNGVMTSEPINQNKPEAPKQDSRKMTDQDFQDILKLFKVLR